MITIIKTDAVIDGRGITATTELDLPADDMILIGSIVEQECRGLQVEIMARMMEERRRGSLVNGPGPVRKNLVR